MLIKNFQDFKDFNEFSLQYRENDKYITKSIDGISEDDIICACYIEENHQWVVIKQETFQEAYRAFIERKKGGVSAHQPLYKNYLSKINK